MVHCPIVQCHMVTLSLCPHARGTGGAKELAPRAMALACCTANKLMSVAQFGLANSVFKKQGDCSSIGRASDCRTLQRSDGPWFDSGRPDICCWVLAHAAPTFLILQSSAHWILNETQAAFKTAVDTLGIDTRASCMLSECDTTTPCAPCLS